MSIPGINVVIRAITRTAKFFLERHKLVKLIEAADAGLRRPLLESYRGAARFDAACALLHGTLVQQINDGNTVSSRSAHIERYLQRLFEEYKMANAELLNSPATKRDVAAVVLLTRELSLTFDRELEAFRHSAGESMNEKLTEYETAATAWLTQTEAQRDAANAIRAAETEERLGAAMETRLVDLVETARRDLAAITDRQREEVTDVRTAVERAQQRGEELATTIAANVERHREELAALRAEVDTADLHTRQRDEELAARIAMNDAHHRAELTALRADVDAASARTQRHHDALAARIGEQAVRHDELASRINEQAVRHDELASRINEQTIRHDELASRIDDHDGRHRAALAGLGESVTNLFESVAALRDSLGEVRDTARDDLAKYRADAARAFDTMVAAQQRTIADWTARMNALESRHDSEVAGLRRALRMQSGMLAGALGIGLLAFIVAVNAL